MDVTLLYNANIIASYNDTTRYKCILFNHTTGKILQLTTDINDITTQYNVTQRIDCDNNTIIPGLIDSHIHVQYVGKHIVSLDLNQCSSITMLQQRLSSYVTTHITDNTQQWIVGYGWEQDRLGRYPTCADIDAICSDRPVMLWRICHHICVCNTIALKLANITSFTQHSGGIIDIDTTGLLTGILRERSAEIVSDMIVDTYEQRKQYIIAGLQECLQNGLTCVQTNDSDAWQIYKQLYDEGKLPIRVFLTIMHDELSNNKDSIPKPNQWYYTDDNDYMLQCHRVKLFADGALGSETAALSDNYVTQLHEKCNTVHSHNTQVHNKGVLIHAQTELNNKVKQAKQHGYRVELHVIGDAAADSGLTAFEYAKLNTDDRPILTHCQVLRNDLLPRIKQVGAIANIQPQFTVTDSRWISDRLPAHLLQYSYIWKTLLESNIHVAGGSDAPIEVPNPLFGMYSAIYRPYERYDAIINAKQYNVQRNDVDSTGRWQSEQCLTPVQALQIYTTEGAYCAGVEHMLGQLTVGYLADFTVLEFDLIKEPEKLLNGKVSEVWVHGKKRL